MEHIMLYIMIVLAYLLGAVPFGYLIAKSKGIDLRKVGSGNIGATNLGRALGKKWAILCFFLDSLKGFIPMMITANFISSPPLPVEMWLWLAVGCAAVLGHIFPVYLKFKGGKGVATSLGMLLGLWPFFTVPGLVSFMLWGMIFLVTRVVSLASIIAAAAFPAILLACIAVGSGGWNIKSLWPLLLIGTLMTLLVIFRHRDNIKRLMAGNEKQIKKDN